MQHNCFAAARHAAHRNRARIGGYITTGTLLLAAASATLLVMMSGCHSAPATHSFASTSTDKAAEARLVQVDAMAPLQPYDEHFVVESPAAP
jgi:hypothetical protein